MNLRKTEEALRNLIKEKLDMGDYLSSRKVELRYRTIDARANLLQIRSDEVNALAGSRRDIAFILDRLESEKRIYTYEGNGGGFNIWTTPEYYESPNLTDLDVSFDEKTGTLLYGGHEIRLRVGDKMYHVARAMFRKGKPLSRPVSEDTILEKYLNDESIGGRTVLDAKYALNKKVEEATGKDDLFVFEGSRLRLNP